LTTTVIDEQYTAHPFYGSRRRVIYLQQQGHTVNRKHVRRLMRVLGEAATAADELTPDTLPAARSPGGRDDRDIPAGEYPLEFYRASPA
jgi:hypothetical protein